MTGEPSAPAGGAASERTPTDAAGPDIRLDAPHHGVTRRGLLLGGGLGLGLGGIVGAASGFGAARATAPGPGPTAAASSAPVPAHGARQAGVDRPGTPQRNALVAVADLDGSPTADGVRELLAAVGEAVDAVTTPGTADRLVVPDGPGDLVVTIGIGPRLVAAIDPGLPGAQPLPVFASDADLDPSLSGGDLFVAAYSSDASVLHGVVDRVLAAAGGARRRWVQPGVRGAGEGTVVRNPFGYHDGIVVPRTPDEVDRNVWIAGGAAADATIAVVRRLRLDVPRFHAEPLERQDQIVGRTRREGGPLSGGGLLDEANLTAKTPEGEFLVPLRSHVRAAHPSFTGSALMMRRGYAFSNAVAPGAEPDDGLMFLCYQNALDVFVRTQRRLDELDDLMTYATPTASATFLIVPGRLASEPLGTRLFAR